MRMHSHQLVKINDLAARALACSPGGVTPSDISMAINHVRWLLLTDPLKAEHWHTCYAGCFRRIGVAFPAFGKDLRSLSSGRNGAEKGGRPVGVKETRKRKRRVKKAVPPATGGLGGLVPPSPVAGAPVGAL